MSIEQTKLLSAKLNMEAEKVSWQKSHRFFVSGMLLKVDENLDIVNTVSALATGNKLQVEQWLSGKRLDLVQDYNAIKWHKQDALWSVVVRLWVLFQE